VLTQLQSRIERQNLVSPEPRLVATLAALLEVASEAEEVVAMVELLVVEVVDDRSTSPTFPSMLAGKT